MRVESVGHTPTGRQRCCYLSASCKSVLAKNIRKAYNIISMLGITKLLEGLLEYYDVLYDTHLGEQRPEKKDTCAAEYSKRISTILEVHAFSIGSIENECDGPRATLHPDLLDVDRAIKDILHAVAAFEHRDGTGLTADF